MKTRALLAVALLVLMGIYPPSRAHAANAFPQIEQSLALIGALDRSGELSSLGTAFCVSVQGGHAYLLTNDHVVTDDNDRPERHLIVIFAKDMTSPHPQRYAASIVRRSDDPDLAIVQVDATGVTPVQLSTALPSVGDDIAIAGFPYNESVLWGGLFSGHGPLLDRRFPPELVPSEHKGSVSAIHGGSYYIQYDALTDSGNSGGPLFDPSSGLVYGVVQATLEGSHDGRDLPSPVRNNLAISLDEGWHFVAQAPVNVTNAIAAQHFSAGETCSLAQRRFDEAYGQWAHGRSGAAFLQTHMHDSKYASKRSVMRRQIARYNASAAAAQRHMQTQLMLVARHDRAQAAADRQLLQAIGGSNPSAVARAARHLGC